MTIPMSDIDRATVDLIFALRDSITDDSVDYQGFWSGGRCLSALQAAAAGSETAGQAVSEAARKLQITQYATRVAPTVVRVASVIDADYPAWARHIDTTGPYLLALADVERQRRKAARSESAPTPTTTETTPEF